MPPVTGFWWQLAQDFSLSIGPKPSAMVSCSSKCSWSSAKLSPVGSASPLPEQLLMPGGYGPSGQPEGVVKAAGASLVVGDCAVPAKASERTKAATTSQGLWWGKCIRDIPVLLAGRKPKRWFVSTKANASEAALELADEVRLPGKLETVIQKLGGF